MFENKIKIMLFEVIASCTQESSMKWKAIKAVYSFAKLI